MTNADEQRKINALLERSRKLQNEIAEAGTAQERSQEALRKIAEEVANGFREQATMQRDAADAAQEALKSAQQQKDALQDRIKDLKSYAEVNSNLSADQALALQTEIDALEAKTGHLDGIIAKSKEINDEAQKALDIQRQSAEIAGDILQKTLGISDAWKGTNFGKFYNIAQQTSFSEALTSVGKSMSEVLTTANIVGSTLMKVGESTAKVVVELDQQISAFRGATGAGEEYNEVIFQATLEGRDFSASIAQSTAAVQELYTGMSGFTGLTQEAQAETAAFTAGMTKLGVAGTDTGQILDNAMKGWGMSMTEAQDVSKELLATATALQVPPGKMAQDFNSAMKELAKYGPQGIDVFKGLAATAKAAGVEVNELMGIAGQFDTIEGAASASGQLNAILGGNLLNSMQMLNATEEERIRLLQQSVAASGRSWTSMGRFEKQAIMAAAGIQDMNTANKLFGQNLSVFDDALEKASAAGAAQANMAEMTEAATSMGEKFNLVMERMAVAVMPIISVARFLLNTMLGIMDVMFDAGEAIEDFGDSIPILGAPLKWLGWLLQQISGPAGVIGVSLAFAGLVSFMTGAGFMAPFAAFSTAIATTASNMWASITATQADMTVKQQHLLLQKSSLLMQKLGIDRQTRKQILDNGDYVMGIKSIALRTKDIAVSKAQALWGHTTAAATRARTLAMSLNTTAGWANLGVQIKNLAATTASTAASWALTAATGIKTGVLWLATTAQTALNAAMLANPIGLVVLAVVALVAVLWYLPEILSFVADGFIWVWEQVMNLWDGFVGFFTEAGAWMDWLLGIGAFFVPFLALPLLIIRYWEPVKDFFVGLFTDPLETIKSFINVIIDGVNWLVTNLNKISIDVPSWVPFMGGKTFGFNMSTIPHLETGGKITSDGIAAVHEGEVVVSEEMAAKAEDEGSTAFDKLIDQYVGFFKNPLGGIADMVGGLFDSDEEGEKPVGMEAIMAAIEKNTAAISKLASAQAAGAGGNTIVLKVGERELGRATTKALNAVNNIAIS